MKKILKWIEYGRYQALMQSLMPAVLAVVLSIGAEGFCWWCAVLAVFGVCCAHLAMNIADDWFDYRVDMMGDRDRVIRKGFRAMTMKYPYLTDGTQTLRSTAVAIACFVIVACTCGLAIFIHRTAEAGLWGIDGSWWIAAIVAICAFLGIFYSAPPIKLAYRGLGELVIGFIFGPLLMCGVYYASCGKMDWSIAAVGVPVGILVLNILFTHSFIDMESDAESNKMTFARVLGSRKACLVGAFVFNLVPFAIVLAAVIAGFLHPAYLAVLLVLPRAIWLCRSLVRFKKSSSDSGDIPEKPSLLLGPMPLKQWDKVREAGIDWFLMRWLCARNILSGFCLVFIIVKILLVVCL